VSASADPSLARTQAVELDRRARTAMAARDARQATALVRELVSRFPGFASGWLTASILDLDLGRTSAALQACRQGVALAPDDGALRVQHVRCLAAAGRRLQALEAAHEARAMVSADPLLQHELANAFSLLGEYSTALELMRAAAPADAPAPALNYNMATVLRFLGRFAEAETLLDAVIAAAPGDFEAYGMRSQLRTQTPDRNHVAQLEALLQTPPREWSGEVQLRYALAKEYEDLGRFSEGFAQLERGAALRRRRLAYDVAGDIAAMESITRTFDAAWLAQPAAGADGGAPIFVFGLPRSGTTLVERILSSHPQVRGLGELNDFPACVIAAGRRESGDRPIGKEALIPMAARAELRALGEAYLARTADQAAGALRFVDKLPMNYLYAGLIAKALPEATLVLVERHPMACGYAMFKTLFHQGYPFSYDLTDLGRYVRAYGDLVAHWRNLLGERLVVVSYERLVREPDTQTRRLVAQCGLDWDDACLAPQANPAASSTQSAVQVRRPIYTDAVEHWRHYERQLDPYARALKGETC
jgi:tetratricopeptide (TPR) repeat protein